MGIVVWFTGLSGSGKSTLAELLRKKLEDKGKTVEIIDGDAIRASFNRHLGFTREDIKENNKFVAGLAKEKAAKADFVLVPIISPYKEDRDAAREAVGDNFKEFFVSCALQECIRRDVKGLYKKA